MEGRARAAGGSLWGGGADGEAGARAAAAARSQRLQRLSALDNASTTHDHDLEHDLALLSLEEGDVEGANDLHL
eukprot:COSAG04_NODE_27869_length_279_cov_0.816667_1_plen_73_part_10